MKFKRLFKLCVSLVLLGLVLYFVDFKALTRVLIQIPAWVVLTVIIGYAAGQILSSYKWWKIAVASGIETPYPNALKSYFIGMFVNSFGLGVVGGDLTRALLLADDGKNKATALASVAADRIQGLAVLLGIGCGFALLIGSSGLEVPTLISFIVLLVVVSLSWVYGPSMALKIFSPTSRVGKAIIDISHGFPRSLDCILEITLLSLCFHCLQISLHWIICLGLGVQIPFSVLFATIPFVNIFSSLPISWNGLGVREGAYLFFLTPLYLSNEQVIAMGALWLLAATISSAIGGLISFVTKDEKLNEVLASSTTA